MKKTLLLICISSFIFISFKPNEPVTWKLDTSHSGLGFSILHLEISDLKGSVKINHATIKAPKEDFSDATISIEVNMTTIDTDNDDRDNHLESADFFDATKFPVATFQSSKFYKNDSGNYTIEGNLTMHGITKPATFMAMVKTGLNPMDNKPIAGFKVWGTIKRTDFGISTSTPVSIISDEVNIETNLEFNIE